MIPIQNIYYMLSYAFQTLQAENYKDLAAENFHNTAELCAAILDKGIGIQLKHGLRNPNLFLHYRENLTFQNPSKPRQCSKNK